MFSSNPQFELPKIKSWLKWIHSKIRVTRLILLWMLRKIYSTETNILPSVLSKLLDILCLTDHINLISFSSMILCIFDAILFQDYIQQAKNHNGGPLFIRVKRDVFRSPTLKSERRQTNKARSVFLLVEGHCKCWSNATKSLFSTEDSTQLSHCWCRYCWCLSMHSGLGARPASLYSRNLEETQGISGNLWKLEGTPGNSRKLLMMLVFAQWTGSKASIFVL